MFLVKKSYNLKQKGHKSLKYEILCLILQRVFHSIRFKVNKGWSTAVLLFFVF